MKRISGVFLVLGVFAGILVRPALAWAGITVIQALSFGEFVIKDNSAQYDLTINPDGTYTYDPAGFVMIQAPREGIYDIDGLPPSAIITSVVVTQIGPLQNVGEDLEMVNYQTLNGNANGAGVAQVVVGATARTSGSGTAYIDQTYTGTLQVTLNY